MPAGQGPGSALAWRKSSMSDSKDGCVEVADTDAAVLVRDTRNRSGTVLSFPAARWSAFIRRVRDEAPDTGRSLLAGDPPQGGRVHDHDVPLARGDDVVGPPLPQRPGHGGPGRADQAGEVLLR